MKKATVLEICEEKFVKTGKNNDIFTVWKRYEESQSLLVISETIIARVITNEDWLKDVCVEAVGGAERYSSSGIVFIFLTKYGPRLKFSESENSVYLHYNRIFRFYSRLGRPSCSEQVSFSYFRYVKTNLCSVLYFIYTYIFFHLHAPCISLKNTHTDMNLNNFSFLFWLTILVYFS